MGEYREKKLEYWKGSTGPLKLYMNFILPVYVIIAVISLTWNVTVKGYTEPVFFLLDFLVCALSVAALFSIYAVDRYTVFGNIPFLLAVIGAKVYRTLYITGVVTPASTSGVGAAEEAMGGMAIGGAMDGGAAMGGMAMDGMASGAGMDMIGGMGGMGGMDGGVAMINENLSLFGKLVAKAASGIFKQAGDLTRFIATLECELFICVCLFFIVYFLLNSPFFFSSLQKLREKAEGA